MQCSEPERQMKNDFSHWFQIRLICGVKERWVRSYSGYCFPLWLLWISPASNLSPAVTFQINCQPRVRGYIHSSFGHSGLYSQIRSHWGECVLKNLFIVNKMSNICFILESMTSLSGFAQVSSEPSEVIENVSDLYFYWQLSSRKNVGKKKKKKGAFYHN